MKKCGVRNFLLLKTEVMSFDIVIPYMLFLTSFSFLTRVFSSSWFKLNFNECQVLKKKNVNWVHAHNL